LIEISVALGVMFVALFALAYSLASGLSSVGFARQREIATGLANQALEQMRALPFDQLDMGNADLAASVAAGETGLTVTGSGATTVYSFRGREIPRAEVTNQPPLVPHTTTTSPGPGVAVYTVRTYVTKDAANPDTHLVTVRVSWSRALRSGVLPVVEVETIVTRYSCDAQPGPQPCGAYWYAKGDAPGVVLGISGSLEGKPSILGTLNLTSRTSQVVTEQLTSAGASGSTSQAYLKDGALTPSTLGGAKAAAAADDSLATATSEYDGPTTVGPDAGGSLTLTGSTGDGQSALALSLGGGATAGAVGAAVAAGQTPPMGGGPVDDDDLGYSRASAGQGQAALVTLTITHDDDALGAANILSAGAPGAATLTTADRDPGPDATGPTDDEILATAEHQLGTVDLFGMPSGANPGVGWAGYLIRLSGWSASSTAGAGPGAVDSGTEPTQSGTISYWNGDGYTSVDLGAGAVDADVSATATVLGCTFTVSGRLQAGGTSESIEHEGGVSTNPIVRAQAIVESPARGAFSYQVTCDGDSFADLTLDLDLGRTVAETRYAVPGE
jgi:hypothetical protein